MRALRTAIAGLLILGLSTPAFAGDLASSISQAAQQTAAQKETQPKHGSKALVAAGGGLFVGGMAVGLYAFINNKNGEFAEFGEANAVNKKLGAAALFTAFGGGLLMYLGRDRSPRLPSVSLGPGQVKVSKQVSW
jgi:hypothetical protein